MLFEMPSGQATHVFAAALRRIARLGLLIAIAGWTLAGPVPASAQVTRSMNPRSPGWREFAQVFGRLGDRNWIVIADAAWPLSSQPGYQMIQVGGDPAEALASVLMAVDAAPHLRPVVFMSEEVDRIPEDDAPGMDQYRKNLAKVLKNHPAKHMPHKAIVGHLDQVVAKHVVSSLLEAREATLAGLGICRLPQYLCEPYLRAGSLVDLTPDIESTGREVVVISPRVRQRKPGTAALRIFIEGIFRHSTH